MREPKNIKALETGSGITWKQWVDFLKPHNTLDHTAMAKLVYVEIMRVGKAKSPEWWAQGVTLAYEQYIGRRQPGQTCDGNFSVTVTKTVLGDMDTVFGTWTQMHKKRDNFNDILLSGVPRTNKTDKWRYWRVGLVDGSKISVNIQTKPNGEKSMLAINHDKLNTVEDVEKWRAYWRKLLMLF